MNRHTSRSGVVALWLMLGLAPALPAQVVQSPGITGTSITFDGTEAGGEWTGAYAFVIDYMNGDPLTADVKAFHDAAGVYLLVEIADVSNNNNDALWLRFDLDHSAGDVDANDWGIDITRSGQATWGELTVDPGTWAAIPSDVGVSSTGTGWTVEIRLPTGAPSGLDLTTGTVGAYFALYDADLAFSPNSAKYTQWPAPADLNTVADGSPDDWGDYTFDPVTTFADLAVTNVRQGTVPENYRKINTVGPNEFYITVNNPNTGAVLPDANDVRFNLYLAARGIGEPFHRLDAENVLNADCETPPPPTLLAPEPDVCDGNTPWPDISGINLADAAQRAALVGGTAQYTVFDGVSRFGTAAADPRETVAGGFSGSIHVLDWTLTSSQTPKFSDVLHNGTTYKRGHQCMKAEAIFANDPNPANNTRQVNMDFVSLMAMRLMLFPFTLGSAGFGDFESGEQMFLQASFANLPDGANWTYEFEGLERIGDNAYVAAFRDRSSIPIQLALTASDAEFYGRTLKEHLLVPPDAGGELLSEGTGSAPVYVKVEPGSTLLIANFALDENDIQYVDLDGEERALPRNGPEGLGFVEAEEFEGGQLLARGVAMGALVGSFDNFETAFKVGPGVQARVPGDASYLALAINDANGAYSDNEGTGFRVKVTERTPGRTAQGAGRFRLVQDAVAQDDRTLAVVAIEDVVPTLCVRGYEAIEERRALDGTPHELYRYIGEVCWSVLNVYPEDRSEQPEEGDPYQEEEKKPWWPGGCGSRSALGFGFSFALSIFGFAVVGRRTRRRDTP